MSSATHSTREHWNKGKLIGQKSTIEAQRYLGDSCASSIAAAYARTGVIHTKLESTVRYLEIEVDDALELAEQTEVQ
jgi:hypothetical protein